MSKKVVFSYQHSSLDDIHDYFQKSSQALSDYSGIYIVICPKRKMPFACHPKTQDLGIYAAAYQLHT